MSRVITLKGHYHTYMACSLWMTSAVKKTILLVLGVVVAVVFVARFIPLPPTPVQAHIELKSNPYPLVIGQASLFFSVIGANGAPVETQDFAVDVEMNHAAMLSLYAPVTRTAAHTFQTSIIWSMYGEWYVRVQAVLADGTLLKDTFPVYVYPIMITAPDYENQFRSESQNQSIITDPDHQYVITIPQGTQAMQLAGMVGEMIFPEEIRLSVRGKNTLIIQNNDLVTHTVGPFTIAPGEVIRQTFTAPNKFVGVCTIGMSTVSIIIEE